MKTYTEHLKKLFFRDRTGGYITGQPPNGPLYLVFVGLVGSLLLPAGIPKSVFEVLSTGAVFLWSYLEIVYGESLFRRIIGGVVMGMLFYSRIQ